MSAQTELDDETRARLRWDAEKLAAEQDISLKAAREIVWADYLDELAAVVTITAQPVAAPEDIPVPEPEETPVPESPEAVPAVSRHPVRGFWQASAETFFTPERLQRNREEIAKVKRLVGAKQ